MADRNEYLEDPMWYVVHTYSGYENKVKTNIDKSIQNLHLEDQILDVQVPVQEVIEVKDGKKKTVQKKLFPGYVLLHMIMNDETMVCCPQYPRCHRFRWSGIQAGSSD